MAVDRHQRTLLAFNRFGFGARPGDLREVADDPRGALLAELQPGAALIKGLPTSAERLVAQDVDRRKRRQFRREVTEARAAQRASAEPVNESPGAAMGSAEPSMEAGMEAPAKPGKPRPPDPAYARESYLEELAARFTRVHEARLGYLERLVAFWSNHFAVEADKGQRVRTMIGAFEREAIRPHVLGKFSDMLKAVAQHPAMLVYLDNFRSVGPNSFIGKTTGQGLNENLARELLELHTVGVDAGYSQADVTALARVLTGWGIVLPRAPGPDAGTFAFSIIRHEPGTAEIMGRRYAQEGMEQGLAVLDDLARHPATARHVARKLATAFVADAPPEALVERLRLAFTESEGDLGHLAQVLVSADEAWTVPRRKIRSPVEFVLAAMRALDLDPAERMLVRAARSLGEEPLNPESPKGFPVTSEEWLAPDALTNRLDFAQLVAARAFETDPRALLEAVIGEAASAETRQAVARAESPRQGIALLLMSPEFQRR